MRAPEIDVLTSSGETVPFSSFYAERAVGVVFLRHLGCLFCRRHVSQLRRHPELNLVFVSMGSPEETREFEAKWKTVHPFLCDPEKTLFEKFGLTRAKWSQIVGPRVLLQGAASIRYGVGTPLGDPMQLAGTFVINRSGEVVWSHRARDASDNASAARIGEALVRADAVTGVAGKENPGPLETPAGR